jgi:hypothetical protein
MMNQFWHGGARWEGGPEVQPPKAERCECGPGIYLTTSYQRARDYARGGKVTTLATLGDEIRWLESAKLPLATIEAYVNETPRFPQRDRILARLARFGRDFGQDAFPVSIFVNTCINNDLLTGRQGVLLAQWLVAQGIDASLYDKDSGEQWVIVVNYPGLKA